MSILLNQVINSSPLFILVFVGYAAMRVGKWPRSMSESLSRFVFTLAFPALLFHLMSDLSKLPPVDARLLIAFFGGCFVVFALGRLLAWKCFKLDGTGQSVFALGGVFCNNLMLGLPLAKMLLGDQALPSVALVVIFNSLILWTLVTISVEWAKHGSLSVQGFGRTLKNVLMNPIVASIMTGTAWGLSGLGMPAIVNTTLDMIGSATAPMALIALGMGLAEYGIGKDWRMPAAIALLKLVAHPLAVLLIAMLLGLPEMETLVVVLMASIATGANVYLMARQFQTQEGPIASSLILTTVLASITSPLVLSAAKYALA